MKKEKWTKPVTEKVEFDYSDQVVASGGGVCRSGTFTYSQALSFLDSCSADQSATYTTA